MPRTVLALFLYLGLASFFLVNGMALLAGVSVFTALARGFSALGVFAVLGVIASVAFRPGKEPLAAPENWQGGIEDGDRAG